MIWASSPAERGSGLHVLSSLRRVTGIDEIELGSNMRENDKWTIQEVLQHESSSGDGQEQAIPSRWGRLLMYRVSNKSEKTITIHS